MRGTRFFSRTIPFEVGADSKSLSDRLAQETDPSIRQALILA